MPGAKQQRPHRSSLLGGLGPGGLIDAVCLVDSLDAADGPVARRRGRRLLLDATRVSRTVAPAQVALRQKIHPGGRSRASSAPTRLSRSSAPPAARHHRHRTVVGDGEEGGDVFDGAAERALHVGVVRAAEGQRAPADETVASSSSTALARLTGRPALADQCAHVVPWSGSSADRLIAQSDRHRPARSFSPPLARAPIPPGQGARRRSPAPAPTSADGRARRICTCRRARRRQAP